MMSEGHSDSFKSLHNFIYSQFGFRILTTNLSPQAKEKWAEVVACRSKHEKIKLMKEFISVCPKHKGTSNLLVNVKRSIVSLQDEIEKTKTRRKGGRGRSFSTPKDGAGQIVILGPTNVGKSCLLSALTNANPEINPVPFTTLKPVIGMLRHQDIQFQLIEAPAIIEGAARGRMEGSRILGLARNADGLILMVDLLQDPVAQFKMLHAELDEAGILIEKPEGEVKIQKRSMGREVQVIGSRGLADCTVKDVERLLTSYRIYSALVKVTGKVRLDDIEDSLFSNSIYKPTLIIVNKKDTMNGENNILRLEEVVEPLPMIFVSCESKQGLDKIGEYIFQMLKIIRVYCKEPTAKKPSDRPLIVKEQAKVADVVKKLGKALYKEFKYARIWGKSAKYPGEKVGLEHTMKDSDIIEVH